MRYSESGPEKILSRESTGFVFIAQNLLPKHHNLGTAVAVNVNSVK